MNSESLMTIAEVAAGFIGFGVVATTVLSVKESSLGLGRLNVLIFACMLTIVSCFVPSWIASEDGSVSWKIAMYVYLALSSPWLVLTAIFAIRNKLLLKLAASSSNAMKIGFPLVLVVQALTGFSLIFSWPFESHQRFYEILLCSNLCVAALAFVDMVVMRDRAEARRA